MPTLSTPPGLPGLPSSSIPGGSGDPGGTGDAGSAADGSSGDAEGGSQPGLEPAGGEGGRDSSTGDAGNLPGQSDGGDYSLDTLPGGGVFQGGAGSGQSGGAMTAAERAAVLDDQLRRTYETHDEILRREQADARGAAESAGGGGGGGQGGMPQPAGQGGGIPNGVGGADVASDENRPGSAPEGGASHPPPDDIPSDIPSGRDDDVVARQLREAAMTEPDPELREALWDEYRNYTGIGN